ncbi:MAG: alpha/beta fold hydrolase [Proteobacteria bacterium]|nr:alpha/beta fold hydrolase [Pseudomonadota bacterium]
MRGFVPGTSHLRFGDCELDLAAFELRRGGQPQAVEPQVFELLAYLAGHPGRLITKDEIIAEVWGGRIVSDAALSSRIKAARRAIGDDGEQQRFVRTVHGRGFRFAAEALFAEPVAASADPVEGAGKIEQQIRFCRAADGVQLAFSRIGQGPPLIKTGNWLTHLEFDLESPIWRHLYRELAKDHSLIRYDARGNGLSDWQVDEISFEAAVRDLEAVADAACAERFALLGISQGCAASIAYAVRHPERVSHLILYGGFALGWRKRGTAAEREQGEAMVTLMQHGWGRENPAFRQLFTSQFVPGGTKEQADWFNELQRISASPENAARFRRATGDVDVTPLLTQVNVPTLVMHAHGDANVPFDAGRQMAAGIPGARFVPLQGRNHLFLEDEPAFARFLDETRNFLCS